MRKSVRTKGNSLKSKVLVFWTSYSLLEIQKFLELIVFSLYVCSFSIKRKIPKRKMLEGCEWSFVN